MALVMEIHSVESEMHVLGALMMRSAQASEVLGLLTPADFFDERHRAIYAAIQRLRQTEHPVDYSTVNVELKAGGNWSDYESDYLMQICEGVPAPNHAMGYAKTIVERAERRQIEDGLRKVQARVGNGAANKDIARALMNLARIAEGRLAEGAEILQTVRYGDAFTPVVIEYHSEPYFPKAKCVLLDADGGTFKTSVMLGLAAAWSNGFDPLSGKQITPLRTLYLHKGEDTNDELYTVYNGNKGVVGMIEFEHSLIVLNEAGVRRITKTVEHGKFDVVVFDALFYFLQGEVEDSKDALDVLKVMQRLNGMASRTGATIVDIRHTTKGRVNKDASELGMGSVQFRNSHRGQLVARWHPKNRGLVVVTDEKGSLLVPRGEPVGYRRLGLELQFVRGIENPFENEDALTKPRLDEAKSLIRELCAGVWMECSKVDAIARSRGISLAGAWRDAKRDMKAAGELEYSRFGRPDGPFQMRAKAEEGFDPYA